MVAAMLKPARPANEAARLQALHALNILDTPAEERFDRYTRLAQHLLQTPIVLISLIDDQRQWFKSRQGLDALETPRDISFCGHAILDTQLFCIPDAALDSRFSDNPLVTEAPNIRFYAGAPLVLAGGERVGTLCAIDSVPRILSDAQRAALMDLASCVVDELQVQNTRAALADREEQLQKSSELVRSIIDTVVDGIITIDARGHVQSVNPAAERLFGYKAVDMIGQNVKLLMPEPFQSAHDGYLHNYLRSGEKKIIGIGREVTGRRLDGSTFPMELSVGEMAVKGQRMFTGIVRDITERNAARQALEESTQRLTLATQAAGIGVWEYDLRTRTLLWDERMFEIYGIKREDFSGAYEAWTRCLHPSQLERTEASLQAAIDGDQAYHTEFTVIWPNAQEHIIEAMAIVQRDRAGEALRMIGVNIDITERKRMERMKNEFVSTVSHELRTPLTSIKGALGLIRSGVTGEIPEKLRAMLDIAYNNSDRLVRLINDILDIEKIEAGRMDFNLRPLDLLPLIAACLEANRAYAKAYGVAYRLESQLEEAPVQADHDRLMQALTNLLSNAAKFSPEGGEVRIRLARVGQRFRIEVCDQGAGIPAAFRDKIFSKFSQADGSDTRQKGGTGLGLNITQAIVAQLGGQIGFESEEGLGTCFYIELPRYDELASAGLALDAVSEPFAGHILVAEDEPDIAKALNQILTQAGFSVDLAISAPEVLTRLGEQEYAAMVLDLHLPNRDRMALLQALRSQQRNADIPVLLVSGLLDSIVARSRTPDKEGGGDGSHRSIDTQLLTAALSKALLPRSSDRACILHVEDDADVRQVVATLLNGAIEVVPAPTYMAAQTALNLRRFDLVLLDLMLPDGSGEELLAQLPLTRNAHAPVVVFSARELLIDKNRAVCSELLKSKTDNDRLLTTIIDALRPPREESLTALNSATLPAINEPKE